MLLHQCGIRCILLYCCCMSFEMNCSQKDIFFTLLSLFFYLFHQHIILGQQTLIAVFLLTVLFSFTSLSMNKCSLWSATEAQRDTHFPEKQQTFIMSLLTKVRKLNGVWMTGHDVIYKLHSFKSILYYQPSL